MLSQAGRQLPDLVPAEVEAGKTGGTNVIVAGDMIEMKCMTRT